MNTIRFAAALALSLVASACGDLAQTGTSPAGSGKAESGDKAGGATDVEGLPLVADVPAGAEKNWGGSGFHTEDGSVSAMIRAVTPTDAKDLAEAKANAEVILFKKWIKSDKTEDGWVLTYIGEGMDMDGKTYENFSFAVRRKIGTAAYECYGGVKKQADLDKNIKLCQSLKAK
jgi:hypothetical protein